MKLSNDTMAVLKNFAEINNGLQFKTGNKLSTISTTRTILAKATLKDTFPQDFCIYDMNRFLAVMNLSSQPEINFDAQNVFFEVGKTKTTYRVSQKTSIVTAPEKDITLPKWDAEFQLKESDLIGALKFASVLQSPNIAFESTGNKLYVTTFDAKDNSAHTNTTEINSIGENEVEYSKFKAVFLKDNLKMIPTTYNVKISSSGLSYFKSEAGDLEYFIAVEAKDSKFGD